MKVTELAAQLQLPASVVLEQCLRLGIEATWAGADLSPADVAILEAELAHEDASAQPAPAPGMAPPLAGAPSVPTVADTDPVPDVEAAPEPAPVGAPSVPSAPSMPTSGAGLGSDLAAQPLPPTAVGSMPEMTDVLMGDAADNTGGGATRTFAGRDLAAGDGLPPAVASERSSGRIAATPHRRRLDGAIRPGFISLALAAAALVGSNALDEPFLIALLWAFGAMALIVAILSGNRARYRITTHPEQRRGLVPAVIILVVGVLGLAALVATTVVTVRRAPAADAPLGVGDLNAVQHARWGYRRLTNVADAGWERPAKSEDSCWETEPRKEPRRDERVEFGGPQVSCDSPHGYEVVGVFAVNRDADAPYPGKAELTAIALARCEPKLARIQNRPPDFEVVVEYPTETGWVDGDHDVACVAVAERTAPLRA